MKKLIREMKGITLIALVVTIIVLLILAGIAINLTVGNNGLFTRAGNATKEYTKAQVKEELEFKIAEVELDNNGVANKDDILNAIGTLDEIVAEKNEDIIEGEYKDYPFEIDENNNVIIEDKLNGVKPIGKAEILTTDADVEEVEIRVTGSIDEGEITSIEAINGAELKTTESEASKIFKVKNNGTYKFKIQASNGRISRVSCDVTNMIATKVDILTAVEEMNNGGLKKIRVIGSENTETYSFNVIYHLGDMTLDGTTSFEGSTLDETNKIYEFGDAESDPANASRMAQNTVVLKVDGNLTINDGVTLTSVKNSAGYGGTKGMIVYCTGTLTNNGTISMTARGAKAEGQNLYITKKENQTFTFIPKVGASGGAGVKGTRME